MDYVAIKQKKIVCSKFYCSRFLYDPQDKGVGFLFLVKILFEYYSHCYRFILDIEKFQEREQWELEYSEANRCISKLVSTVDCSYSINSCALSRQLIINGMI